MRVRELIAACCIIFVIHSAAASSVEALPAPTSPSQAAGNPSTWQKMKRFVRKHREAIISSTVVAAVVAVVLHKYHQREHQRLGDELAAQHHAANQIGLTAKQWQDKYLEAREAARESFVRVEQRLVGNEQQLKVAQNGESEQRLINQQLNLQLNEILADLEKLRQQVAERKPSAETPDWLRNPDRKRSGSWNGLPVRRLFSDENPGASSTTVPTPSTDPLARLAVASPDL